MGRHLDLSKYRIWQILYSQRVEQPQIRPLVLIVNWLSNYIKRHPEIDTLYSRRYIYERAKCEDPNIIREWFSLVQKAQKVIQENEIHEDDTCNFDETGFAMGLTAEVVTKSDSRGRHGKSQPGNRE